MVERLRLGWTTQHKLVRRERVTTNSPKRGCRRRGMNGNEDSTSPPPEASHDIEQYETEYKQHNELPLASTPPPRYLSLPHDPLSPTEDVHMTFGGGPSD